MRSPFVVILFTCLSIAGFTQNYSPIADMSAIKFDIKNFGVNVAGSFKGLQGIIHFNETDLQSVVFDLSVDANTVNTGIGGRDNHLRKEEYFDVQKYPKISFVSKQVTIVADKANTYDLSGILTIKGISRNITFPFMITPQNEGLLFTGSFRINRRDFNVGGSSIILSDYLTVSLRVFAKK